MEKRLLALVLAAADTVSYRILEFWIGLECHLTIDHDLPLFYTTTSPAATARRDSRW